jgi:hypothetical protein
MRNIVGPNNLTTGSHHDVGTQQPWLFGVDFGNWKYSKYTTVTPIKTVFSINFGSGKLAFSRKNNTMKAMLAQTVQYRIYRGLDRFGPYQPLNSSELLAGQQYVDPNPLPGAWYMVRAHSLKEVYAGALLYLLAKGIHVGR